MRKAEHSHPGGRQYRPEERNEEAGDIQNILLRAILSGTYYDNIKIKDNVSVRYMCVSPMLKVSMLSRAPFTRTANPDSNPDWSCFVNSLF